MFNFLKNRPLKVSARDFLEIKDDVFVLDVRGEKEVSKEERDLFPNYTLIPVTKLKEEIDTLDQDEDYYILCRSGQRSTVAAGILSENNIKNKVITGGIISIKKALKY